MDERHDVESERRRDVAEKGVPAESGTEAPDSDLPASKRSVGEGADDGIVRAELVDDADIVDDAVVHDATVVDEAPVLAETVPVVRRRRVKLPVSLFIITCISTFWVGATQWAPLYFAGQVFQTGSLMPLRRTLVAHWDEGLIYMASLLAIVLTHEMGHFIATLRYRIPASFPYFLPLPINPIGTLGAVIAMDGLRANRKEMFDIGLAGPLAGLVVAIPMMLVGIEKLDLTEPAIGGLAFSNPLGVKLMMSYIQPPGYEPGAQVWISQLNPYFMAGWVGLLITGLNMLPVSQLDGGHVIYTMFGRRAHWIARGFILAAVAFIVFAGAWIWSLMVVLVLLIGTDHPPTRDDNMPLGWFRTALGCASLLIPVLCFPPLGLTPV